MLKGVQALHAKKIIHSDIKPENILISLNNNNKMVAKIGDLGLSKKMKIDETHISSMSGTLAFMALEQTEGKLYYESDYFAIGMVICYLCDINFLNNLNLMTKLKYGEAPNLQNDKN